MPRLLLLLLLLLRSVKANWKICEKICCGCCRLSVGILTNSLLYCIGTPTTVLVPFGDGRDTL